MNDQTFDAFARRAAAQLDRRSLLGLLGGTVLAGIVPLAAGATFPDEDHHHGDGGHDGKGKKGSGKKGDGKGKKGSGGNNDEKHCKGRARTCRGFFNKYCYESYFCDDTVHADCTDEEQFDYVACQNEYIECCGLYLDCKKDRADACVMAVPY
jgi:hypothetical protein